MVLSCFLLSQLLHFLFLVNVGEKNLPLLGDLPFGQIWGSKYNIHKGFGNDVNASMSTIPSWDIAANGIDR